MAGERGPHGVGMLVPEARRVLEIGEHEGHRARWQLAHRLLLVRTTPDLARTRAGTPGPGTMGRCPRRSPGSSRREPGSTVSTSSTCGPASTPRRAGRARRAAPAVGDRGRREHRRRVRPALWRRQSPALVPDVLADFPVIDGVPVDPARPLDLGPRHRRRPHLRHRPGRGGARRAGGRPRQRGRRLGVPRQPRPHRVRRRHREPGGGGGVRGRDRARRRRRCRAAASPSCSAGCTTSPRSTRSSVDRAGGRDRPDQARQRRARRRREAADRAHRPRRDRGGRRGARDLPPERPVRHGRRARPDVLRVLAPIRAASTRCCARMFGATDDGLPDRLTEFTRPSPVRTTSCRRSRRSATRSADRPGRGGAPSARGTGRVDRPDCHPVRRGAQARSRGAVAAPIGRYRGFRMVWGRRIRVDRRRADLAEVPDMRLFVPARQPSCSRCARRGRCRDATAPVGHPARPGPPRTPRRPCPILRGRARRPTRAGLRPRSPPARCCRRAAGWSRRRRARGHGFLVPTQGLIVVAVRRGGVALVAVGLSETVFSSSDYPRAGTRASVTCPARWRGCAVCEFAHPVPVRYEPSPRSSRSGARWRSRAAAGRRVPRTGPRSRCVRWAWSRARSISSRLAKKSREERVLAFYDPDREGGGDPGRHHAPRRAAPCGARARAHPRAAGPALRPQPLEDAVRKAPGQSSDALRAVIEGDANRHRGQVRRPSCRRTTGAVFRTWERKGAQAADGATVDVPAVITCAAVGAVRVRAFGARGGDGRRRERRGRPRLRARRVHPEALRRADDVVLGARAEADRRAQGRARREDVGPADESARSISTCCSRRGSTRADASEAASTLDGRAHAAPCAPTAGRACGSRHRRRPVPRPARSCATSRCGPATLPAGMATVQRAGSAVVTVRSCDPGASVARWRRPTPRCCGRRTSSRRTTSSRSSLVRETKSAGVPLRVVQCAALGYVRSPQLAADPDPARGRASRPRRSARRSSAARRPCARPAAL